MQAALIIGSAIAFTVLGYFLPKMAPPWVMNVVAVFFFFYVVGLVAFLIIRSTGWRSLASKYFEHTPYTGPWRKCATFQMLARASGDPLGTRFSGSIVSAATTPNALYLSMPAVVRFLFPTIELPWSAIASAKPFEAKGWVAPIAEPGQIFQVAYDFGFSGQFVELETTAPKVRIRMPQYALDEALANLPLSRA